MFSRLTKTRERNYRSKVTKVARTSVTLSASVMRVMAVLEIVLPGEKLEVLEVEGWCGLNDDPTDEAVTFMIGWIDPTAPPDDTNILLNSELLVWSYQQQWRSIGTVAMVLDVNLDFSDEERNSSQAMREPERGDAALALCMLAFSATTSNVDFHAEVDLERTFTQRKFADDDGWAGYEPEEVNQFA